MNSVAMSAWSEWADLYRIYAAQSSAGGRQRSFQDVADSFDGDGQLDRQTVHYRIRSLEKQARSMAYVAARSAALRALFLKELLRYVDEPWFETYAGFPLGTSDAVVDQVIREVRSAYP